MIWHLKNKHCNLRKVVRQLGLTLTEVGLAVAVSAIVIVVGFSIYKTVTFNAKTTALVKELPVIISAVSSYGTFPFAGHPMDVGYPTNMSPWGTSMDVGYANYLWSLHIVGVWVHDVPECSRVRSRVLAAMKGGYDRVYVVCTVISTVPVLAVYVSP